MLGVRVAIFASLPIASLDGREYGSTDAAAALQPALRQLAGG